MKYGMKRFSLHIFHLSLMV